MKRFVIYLALALFFALLQTSVFPLLLLPNWRPSLILLLVLFVGINEPSLRAVVICMFLGAIQDSFCGHSLGLYLTVYLTILFLVLAIAEQLNVESPPLVLLLIGGGTLLQNLLLSFYLTLLAETDPAVHILLPAIPQQLLANLVFAVLLIGCLFSLQSLLGLRIGLETFSDQGKLHGP